MSSGRMPIKEQPPMKTPADKPVFAAPKIKLEMVLAHVGDETRLFAGDETDAQDTTVASPLEQIEMTNEHAELLGFPTMIRITVEAIADKEIEAEVDRANAEATL